MSDVPPPSHLSAPGRRWVLRFISGKYQGSEHPLAEGVEVVAGRSSDVGMVLAEELVSRKHARFLQVDGAVTVDDLGSTNGTFVNGEKVLRARLREGDRVLVGTSILKLVSVAADVAPAQAVEALPPPRRPQVSEDARRMTGQLEEIPLPDLLQLLGTSRKHGVLVLRAGTRVGRVFLKQGVIRHAEVEGHDIPPIKAVFRMLSWAVGQFELEPPAERPFDPEVELSVQEVLMEGFRQLDELPQALERLPPLGSRLMLRTPLMAPLQDLDPARLDVLQQALNAPSIQALLDQSPLTDLDTAGHLVALVERGYLRTA